MEKPVRVAITIAGSDSGGGAGIEADLKTFAALGVHGTVAITSITAQNTYEVTDVHDIPPNMVFKQIEAVAVDMGIDAGKTGMLSNSGIIEAVVRAVEKFGFPLVVDPVMIAKSGAKLLRDDAVEVLINKLIPLAKVVTPNAPEASRITGIHVKDLDSARKAAKKIVEDIGAEAAVVKGGHLTSSRAVDILYWKGNYYYMEAPRVERGCTHGTGCSFSAAIAAELAKGRELPEAVRNAKKFITTAILYGLRIGKGHCPVNPMAWIHLPAYRYEVLNEVQEAVKKLVGNSDKLRKYMPEVGMNLVMSLPPEYAKSINDVAGVKGRIVKYGDSIRPVGPVKFGVSSHLARLVLEAMKLDHSIRAALNIKYSEGIINKAREKGLSIAFVDRRKEPRELKIKEGGTMQWLVREAYKVTGRIPDIVYDVGDIGKEAMIRILGKTAREVVEKLLSILS
ncbi:MAG: bifunctional hydroxymethylpyrimidine kinase/phosphomethylpyrimidine kinase [Thermoprotei archaeon]|nr:MAG: bifunctional hydroxymethylpyrimidine kinase/phosphomethylpyrimidine kinase [Thermoprotei archaeon]